MHPTRAPARRARSIGVLLALGVLALAALAPGRALAQDPDTVRVVVAVLPFEVHSAKPLSYLEDSLASLLSSRLEASGKVRVVEAVTVRETMIAYPGERTEEAVRRLARELAADYVVVGSLTELAGHYSLDVRVTPVDSLVATATLDFTAEGDDELLDRINELSSRILAIVGGSTPRARVAAIRIVGAPDEEAAQRVLVTQPGDVYDSAIVREDLVQLQALPGVANASVETSRSPEGVTVLIRIVPTERLMPQGPETVPGDRVADIEIRGNQRIEDAAIRARISTQPGDGYSAGRVAQDVREIYGLGFFRNVRVESEDGLDGRLLVFVVEENPVVRQVTISGNDNVDGEKIRDNLTITTGSTLDYPLLFENRERIGGLYRAEGYYLATVRYEIESLQADAVAVHFEVEEGEKLRLTDIQFEGNEHFTDEELRSGLKTKEWRWWSYVTTYIDKSGTYSEPVFLQDLQGVSNKYLNAGYIHVDLGEPDVEPHEDGLTVKIEITEGDQYNVGSIEIDGDESIDLVEMRERLALKEGDVFNRSFLNADLQGLESRYTDRGFFMAEVAPRTRVDDGALTVDVTFDVVKGPLYFLREIAIGGNQYTVDEVVRREMRLVEGQLYSARQVTVSKNRIRRLGFFEEVEFEPGTDRLRRADRPGREGGRAAHGLPLVRRGRLLAGRLRRFRLGVPVQPVRPRLRRRDLRRHRR